MSILGLCATYVQMQDNMYTPLMSTHISRHSHYTHMKIEKNYINMNCCDIGEVH